MKCQDRMSLTNTKPLLIPKPLSTIIIPVMNETTLPIIALKQTFQDAITKGTVVIVAPTGSGKSTQIPSWCAACSDAPVLVVEPRRVDCRSLARWVAQQHGEPLGQSIGYTVRFEDVSSDKRTRIRFVTPGVALRYAAGPELDQYNTIILDEQDALRRIRMGKWESDGAPLVCLDFTPHGCKQMRLGRNGQCYKCWIKPRGCNVPATMG